MNDDGEPRKDENGKPVQFEYVRYLADGGIYTADKALEYGLIDKIGYLDDAVQEAKTKAGLVGDVRVVTYKEPFSLADVLSVRRRRRRRPWSPPCCRQRPRRDCGISLPGTNWPVIWRPWVSKELSSRLPQRKGWHAFAAPAVTTSGEAMGAAKACHPPGPRPSWPPPLPF